MRRCYLGPLTWLVISACLFSAIAQNVMERGMRPPISLRYVLYAIPAAVSILRGHTHDYTATAEVAGPFIYGPEGDINAKIKQQMAMPVTASAGLWFVSGDDKGLIDLTYGAFLAFGEDTNSIVKAIISLLGVSALLFFLEFKRDALRMASLVAILCGIYVVVRTLGITNEASNIAEPRFISVISIVSSLHLMLLVAPSRRLRWGTALIAAAQLCLIIFAVHLRSSEVWQVMAIVAFAIPIAAIDQSARKRAGFIVGLCLVGIAGLAIYKRAAYNAHYFEEEVSTRVFWHNALMGLAINPTIRVKYGLVTLDDRNITEAVRRYMNQNDYSADAAFLFERKEDYAGGNFHEFNWHLYERFARKMYLHVLRDQPLQVLSTYALIAPRLAWENVNFLSNRGIETPRELGGLTITVSPEVRNRQDLYLSLDRLVPILGLAASIIGLAAFRSRFSMQPFMAILCLFGFSLIPPALATPAVQYILMPLSIASALIYLMIASMLAAIPPLTYRRHRPIMADHTLAVPQP